MVISRKVSILSKPHKCKENCFVCFALFGKYDDIAMQAENHMAFYMKIKPCDLQILFSFCK